MKIDRKMLDKLKTFGFKWFKDNCTDAVASNCIQDVIPAAKGFTVIYNKDSVFASSTAVVKKIEVPEELSKQWIFVHWVSIEDEPRI